MKCCHGNLHAGALCDSEWNKKWEKIVGKSSVCKNGVGRIFIYVFFLGGGGGATKILKNKL